MSGYLKHRTNLFLGVAELDRMKLFLDDNGYRSIMLKNSASFGLIKYEADPTFNNFKVVEDIAGSGNYKIENSSFAVDNVGRFISQAPITSLAVPNDGNWYWAKISHAFITEEVGTVNIDVNGNVTGTGTLFTEILRGAPNFPSKINFTNSAGNQLDYDVVEVLNDTTLLLGSSGGTPFVAESDLKYRVVGTFTPGHVPSALDKYPFQYDGCSIELVQETVPETAPAKTEGEEFFIARIMNVGGTLTIQDKRNEIYKTTAEFNLTNILKLSSPLIGVEFSKYKNSATTQDANLVQIGWGMRTDAWSLDAPNRAITFSGAIEAGKYKNTNQFFNGELNGWRVYFTDGSYSEIHLSEKQGSSFKCTLKEVDPAKLTAGDVLRVVPAVDIVEIRAKSDNGDILNVEKDVAFEASTGSGILELNVPASTYSFAIDYRYVKGGESTSWINIPSDTDNGFYIESSFDADGNLIALPTRKTYTTSATSGFIELVRSPSSYIDTIGVIQTGDKFGYETFELDNGSPEKEFIVGTNASVQRCLGTGGGALLSTNHIIGLSNAGAKNGNSFTFIFDVGINDAGFNLTINTGYVDSGTTGTPIKTFSEEDFDYPYLTGKAVAFRCTFTGSEWEVYTIEEDQHRIGDIKTISDINVADFTSGKADLGTKYQGWAICDGNNGTIDLGGQSLKGFKDGDPTDDFPLPGASNYGEIGKTAGTDGYSLTVAQLPPHQHEFEDTFVGGSGTAEVNGGATYARTDTQNKLTSPTGSAATIENRPSYTVVGFLQRIKQS